MEKIRYIYETYPIFEADFKEYDLYAELVKFRELCLS
jgi:hypothetical protein